MQLELDYDTLIAAGIALGILLLLVLIGFWLRHFLEKYRIKRAIRRLGEDVISNVVIADGVEGHVFIEHVVLTPAHMLVVSVRRYPGAIFAANNMDMWAQVTDGGSFKFPNPLHEIQSAILAVKGHLPGIDVKGVIVFDRDSTFPKGKPDGVLHVSEIPKRKRGEAPPALSDEVRQAWSKLQALKTAAA
ncbi:MAG: nuclease-related domain-containing protein [Gammaproteobacteria bacterium]|nr:nuclease-related domain-containing protein [Gammaproteobacteria bacterium]